MKIIFFDKKKGLVKLTVTTQDDLWHLSKVIELHDLVSAWTTRKIKIGEEEERAIAVRKSVYLQINVQKIELSQVLRLNGYVTEGQQDIPAGSSHSLEIGLGTEVLIQKETWHEYQLKRLKEAESASAAPTVLICLLDDEQANFGVLTPDGIKQISQIVLRLSKKYVEEKNKEGLDKAAKELVRLYEQNKVDTIILASPLFWKEYLLAEVKDLSPELAKKIRLEDVSTGTPRGFQELINRGGIDKIVKESRLAKEEKLVNELLKEISKEGLAVYGFKETLAAVRAGAVKVLLVSDKQLSKNREAVEELIGLAEASQAEVHILDTKNEAGAKLEGLGGFGGLTRYQFG